MRRSWKNPLPAFPFVSAHANNQIRAVRGMHQMKICLCMAGSMDIKYAVTKPETDYIVIEETPCVTNDMALQSIHNLSRRNLMYRVLLGNKRDNVIRKIKKSWTAKLMLAGCCIFVYRVFGGMVELHDKTIFLIPVMGVLILNLLYVPIRLVKKKQVQHGMGKIFLIGAGGVALCKISATGLTFSTSILKDIEVGVIILLLLVVGTMLALRKSMTVHSQAGRIHKRDFAHMNGWEFEQWSGEWLRKHGFYNIKVTSGSGDYGADVLCEKAGVTYAVQCKLYSGKVPYRAVEEVICAREYYKCDRAMIFTNSELTAQANEAAKKLGVVVYDGNVIG